MALNNFQFIHVEDSIESPETKLSTTQFSSSNDTKKKKIRLQKELQKNTKTV